MAAAAVAAMVVVVVVDARRGGEEGEIARGERRGSVLCCYGYRVCVCGREAWVF